MIEISVPKDVFKYKAKLTGNFTTRNVVFMLIGVIITFVLFNIMPKSWMFLPKCIICLIPLIICFLFGFLSIQNEPLEKILPRIINDNFFCKKKRTKEIKIENTTRPTIVSVKDSKTYRKVK